MTSPGFSNGRLRGVGNLPTLTSGKIWQGNGSGLPEEADFPTFELEFPNKYMSFADPSYGAADYYVFPWAFARDSTNAVDLSVSGSTNVYTSVATNGILQSANLTGTISVSSGSANVTFSTSQDGVLQVGDVVTTAGGQSRRLASGSGTSWTAESNWSSTENTVTFKRGGKAPSTHYYVYLVSVDGSSSNYATSTRNVAGGDTLVDLGSYVYYRQLPHVLTTDSSSNVIKGVWSGLFFEFQGYYPNFISGGSATSATQVSSAIFVPKTSRMGLFNFAIINSSGAERQLKLKTDSSDSEMDVFTAVSSGTYSNKMPFTVSSSQSFYYRNSGTGCTAYLGVVGYYITSLS